MRLGAGNGILVAIYAPGLAVCILLTHPVVATHAMARGLVGIGLIWFYAMMQREAWHHAPLRCVASLPVKIHRCMHEWTVGDRSWLKGSFVCMSHVWILCREFKP